MWAVVRDVGQVSAPGMDPPKLPPNQTWTTVEFTDLRFGYSYLGAGRTSGRNALAVRFISWTGMKTRVSR